MNTRGRAVLSRRYLGAHLLAFGVAGLEAFKLRDAVADTVTYTYDNLGRLYRAEYSSGTTIQYCYDPAGNRTEIRQQGSTPPTCPNPSPPPPPNAPNGTLSASPASINEGNASTLTWTSTNATSASLSNGIGPVALNGSVGVTPLFTTTYTLTLNGSGGQTTKQATVTVVPSGFYATVPVTGPAPVNLRALANAAGYSGQENAFITFVVASGVNIVGATGSAAPAIDTGEWPSLGYLIGNTLQVDGNVYGGGGNGGAGAAAALPAGAGTPGSDAVYCRAPLSVLVNAGGQIKGGGGGGGGAGSRRVVIAGGDIVFYGGGGGGGGFPNGNGGAGNANGGQPGAAGTTSGGGAGGAGANPGTGSPGGAGGNAGVAGATGGASNFGTPGAGGASGYAIRKNGNTVAVTNNGTISGTQG